MRSKRLVRFGFLFASLVLISMLVGACGDVALGATGQAVPTVVALLPASSAAGATPVPTAVLTPYVLQSPSLALVPVQLVILHTNDNWGETEPCGWGATATGGFRRRATFVAQQRQANEYTIVLDAGEALVGGGLLGDATQGEAVIAGMNLMGYDAMALGPKELALGSDVLQKRMAEAEFAILSANVVLDGTGRLVAEPYMVVDIAGHQVGIIGLTRIPESPQAGFQVIDPKQSAARYVPEVAKQADTIVLLTNIGYRAALEIVEAVPGIDLVVAALPDQLPRAAVRAPGTGTIAVSAEQPVVAHTGRRMGRLVVTLEGDGRLSGESWESVQMGSFLADDSQMAVLLDRYRN